MNYGKTRSIVNKAAAISGIAACLVTFPAAAQQGNTADRLLECDRLSDPELKLACYDAVVNGLKEGESPDSSEHRPRTEAHTAGQEQGAAAIPAAPVEPATALPAEAAAAESSAVDEDFGLENQRAAERREQERGGETEESLEATIVKVTVHHDRRFSVQLDNGQVWRETQGTRVGVPKEGAAVVITAGKLGGYRMTIDGIAREAWVRRMK